ncbi:TBC1 domain family member 5 isoform X2 [Daktulosphaira vitifoliae]|uniref:TBC1 domain family member 5 isoform X2 n=1 Tax=Daktulosphaira vitifoliae TaxID=58002 RepID=UPI0021A9A31D|nr:TBC1 domain family member 5 isoform X2 [Daktulosphaira vitifoliae]
MFYVDGYVNNLEDGQNVAVKLYEQEWYSLFNITSINDLRNVAIQGDLRASRFRSVYWRIMLDIMPLDSSKWLSVINEYRTIYKQKKVKHYNDPHLQGSEPDDPLSQNDNSIWKQYFKDVELKKLIEQDVIRTSPGIQFFQTERIQNIMVNILFCYSREYPDLSYRQGMHEILAPILFVLHCDHQALLHVIEQSSSDVSDTIQQILNPLHLEADAYSQFSTIMDIIKDYYITNDNIIITSEEQSETIKISSKPESEIVRKLLKIRDTMLAKYDPELHKHLINLDIGFTTFGIRWLRLLFGGEFSLMDLLVLWDVIFAKSPLTFQLVNNIFVAMLVLLRVQLLKSDNITCLTYLMKYPPVDVASVIEYALHMNDPEIYPLPSIIHSLRHDKSDILKMDSLNFETERSDNLISSSRRMRNSSEELLELCKIKLLQYHSILNPVVSEHHKDARQALNGMLELCAMLNTQSGIIEMGRDVVRITSPNQTSSTPESPEGPPLPPPASAITMKVFRKVENSLDCQILGAPTKNPLKQLKR